MSKLDNYFAKLQKEYDKKWKNKFHVGDKVAHTGCPKEKEELYFHGKIIECDLTHATVRFDDKRKGETWDSLVPYKFLKRI